jgi:outer membrane protein TolC
MNRPALPAPLRLPAMLALRLPRPGSGASLTAATAALSLLSAALLLAGCASPGEPPPTRPLRDAQAQGATGTATPWPAARWWSVYGDAGLDRLVDQALGGQPSLQATQARLQQARAAVDVAGAASRPQLTGALDLSDQRFTENGLIPPPLAGTTQWNNSAQATPVGRSTCSAASAPC